MNRTAEGAKPHLPTMLGLIALAAIARLFDLGHPGLTQNEDYVMLCARAILDHGAPFLPAGGLYPRALPFSYVAALLVRLLGPSEIAVRLLPALVSIAAVGVGFLFASRVFGRAAGVIAGLMLAASPSVWSSSKRASTRGFREGSPRRVPPFNPAAARCPRRPARPRTTSMNRSPRSRFRFL